MARTVNVKVVGNFASDSSKGNRGGQKSFKEALNVDFLDC